MTKLQDLKKDYSKIQKQYDLPSFDELNKDFQIEKATESETDFLIREVRKLIADKFSNYLRFIEAILNPMGVPMFIFSIIKSLGKEDKQKLTEIYKKLATIEIQLIEVDVDFVEEKEVAFVKESYELWQEVKKDLLNVVGMIKKNWNNKFESNNKGYFG